MPHGPRLRIRHRVALTYIPRRQPNAPGTDPIRSWSPPPSAPLKRGSCPSSPDLRHSFNESVDRGMPYARRGPARTPPRQLGRQLPNSEPQHARRADRPVDAACTLNGHLAPPSPGPAGWGARAALQAAGLLAGTSILTQLARLPSPARPASKSSWHHDDAPRRRSPGCQSGTCGVVVGEQRRPISADILRPPGVAKHASAQPARPQRGTWRAWAGGVVAASDPTPSVGRRGL